MQSTLVRSDQPVTGLNSPATFLRSFAEFVDRRHADTLHRYGGYSGSTGALLIKVKKDNARAVIRPWLRARPVGLADVTRSDERYQVFKQKEPDIHIHIARQFRDNAIRYARRAEVSSLIAYDPKQRAVGIIQSGNIPQPLLDAILAFCRLNGIQAAYDFSGTLVHERSKGSAAQLSRVAARTRNPRVFLSYSWDDDSHRRWVLKLAADLIRSGVHVLVDEWDLHDHNDDLHYFMESGIRDSDFVVLVCTPGYARRANTRRGGVGAESTIITGEFYDSAKAAKFLPIARKATNGLEGCLPTYLKSRYAIDFTKDAEYRTKLEELLRRIFGQPRYRRPELGPMPQFPSEAV